MNLIFGLVLIAIAIAGAMEVLTRIAPVVDPILGTIGTVVKVVLFIPFAPAGIALVLWCMFWIALGISDPFGIQRGTEAIDFDFSGFRILLGLLICAGGYGLVYLLWVGDWLTRGVVFLIGADIFAMYVFIVSIGPVARLLFWASIVIPIVALILYVNRGRWSGRWRTSRLPTRYDGP